MFTGIIQEVGKVKEITRSMDFAQIEITCGQVLSKLNIGDSIAVNGVCLTATKINTVSLKNELRELIYNGYSENQIVPDGLLQTIVLQWLDKIKV